MTDATNENSDWLETRLGFIRQIGFRLTLLEDPLLTMSGGHLARISLRGTSWELFVSDEYKDLEKNLPALSVEVVKRACEEYLDHTNSQSWCLAETIPPRCHLPLRLRWDEFREAAGNILIRLSPIAHQISDLDWQLNAGRAQILRGLGS